MTELSAVLFFFSFLWHKKGNKKWDGARGSKKKQSKKRGRQQEKAEEEWSKRKKKEDEEWSKRKQAEESKRKKQTIGRREQEKENRPSSFLTFGRSWKRDSRFRAQLARDSAR